MKNNNKGITLVALVITIIVLLILAGVTIASLSGDNGILTRGSQAKIDNEVGNAKDIINLAANEGLAAYYGKTYSNIAYESGIVPSTNDEKGAVIAYINNALTKNKMEPVTPGTSKGFEIISDKKSGVYKINYDGATKATATVGTKGEIAWTNK